jgi:hypothetical protein
MDGYPCTAQNRPIPDLCATFWADNTMHEEFNQNMAQIILQCANLGKLLPQISPTLLRPLAEGC